MTAQRVSRFARLDIPELRRVVMARRGECFAVGREGYRRDRVGVTFESADQLAGPRVPQSSYMVGASGRQHSFRRRSTRRRRPNRESEITVCCVGAGRFRTGIKCPHDNNPGSLGQRINRLENAGHHQCANLKVHGVGVRGRTRKVSKAAVGVAARECPASGTFDRRLAIGASVPFV